MAGVQGDSDLLSFGVKARLGASAKSRRGTLAFVTHVEIPREVHRSADAEFVPAA